MTVKEARSAVRQAIEEAGLDYNLAIQYSDKFVKTRRLKFMLYFPNPNVKDTLRQQIIESLDKTLANQDFIVDYGWKQNEGESRRGPYKYLYVKLDVNAPLK